MAQLYSPHVNLIVRMILVFAPLFSLMGGATLVYSAYWSDWPTERFHPIVQPIAFSHEHHVGGLGLDCRYCHSTVENAPFAGMPSTETCMTCHWQMWKHAPMLDPLRQSWADQKPLHWNRVHDLPDYVYFDHSIHVAKGIGCSTCHGDVGGMPLEERVVNLQMRWCIDCHRDPEKHLRPQDEIFDSRWVEPADQLARGRELLGFYHVQTDQLTNCSLCHR